MKLIFAVTTYNRPDFLKECLNTWDATRSKDHDWTLIIADDGSADVTKDYLKSLKFHNVSIHVIHNNRNGVAHQTNTIFNVLERLDFDVCFKADDDVFFLKSGWDDLYVATIRNSGYDHLVYDNENFNTGLWCEGGVLKQPIIKDNLIARVGIKHVKGCFYTVTKKMLTKVGYLDSINFKHGLEHTDYTYRASRLGFNHPDYPFDCSNSEAYISYRFPWERSQLSINLESYQLNGNSISETEEKLKLLEIPRTYIGYNESKSKMKDNIKKFIIFGVPRSGTSNFKKIIEVSANKRIAGEPFNEHYASWHPSHDDYSNINTKADLDAALNKIFEKFDGIKTLTYQLTPSLNAYLLSKDYNFIVLRRHDFLEQAISAHIAMTTGIWQNWSGDVDINYESLNLDPASVVKMAKDFKYQTYQYNEYFHNHKISEYRDLYGPNRISIIKELIEYLGIEHYDLNQIEELSSIKYKLNKTYERIKNIKDIRDLYYTNKLKFL